jgi:molybdopterin/thiamine biosynthesis adenylyltransferase
VTVVPGKLHHEQLYRGEEPMKRLSVLRIALCGAGALGSNLADNLVRQGVGKLRVIDLDRVQKHNVSTQIYGEAEIGAFKVEALRNRLFRATGVEIESIRKELNEQNARQVLKDVDLIIDTFDNSRSRRIVQETSRALGIPCVHAGLFADYGEIVWDENYRIPRDVGRDVCDYPLARNLVMLTVAVASELVVRFTMTGEQSSRSITLKDFAVREM